MAQATFSVRMDENLKNQFDALCRDFGMNTSTAINVFARAVVRERRIPFEIFSGEPLSSRKPLFIDELTEDELNAELAKGYDDAVNGRVIPADKAFSDLRRKHGI